MRTFSIPFFFSLFFLLIYLEAMKVPSFDKDDSRGALILLTMAANADPEIIRSKLNLVINVGLGPRWKVFIGGGEGDREVKWREKRGKRRKKEGKEERKGKTRNK